MSTLTTTDVVTATTISSGAMNTNFGAVETVVNGNLDTDNLSDSAGVKEAQLASGSTGLAKGSFSAYRANSLSITSQAIIFDAEDWDPSGWYSTSTGRFTPLTAGYYRLSACLRGFDMTSAEVLRAEIYKNGSLYKYLGNSVQGSDTTVQAIATGSVLVVANGSTDYFQVFGTVAGAGQTLTVGADRCFFQGELVGRS